MDVNEYNRNAWNLQSREGDCQWSTPFPDAQIEQARKGIWEAHLSPGKPVPRTWFPASLEGCEILCLASGGGQQAPLFAAAGARVTSVDHSDVQLEKDQVMARRHGLDIETVHADMADLSQLADGRFDLIFNPVSNVYCPELPPIWRECARVLKTGGELLAAFMNPDFYLFDHDAIEQGEPMQISYRLPYSDIHSRPPDQLENLLSAQLSLEYSHSWQSQLGGQTDAGLAIVGFYEDGWQTEATPLHDFFPLFGATRARKLA
jgi:SAM-dependent methyltransferase